MRFFIWMRSCRDELETNRKATVQQLRRREHALEKNCKELEVQLARTVSSLMELSKTETANREEIEHLKGELGIAKQIQLQLEATVSALMELNESEVEQRGQVEALQLKLRDAIAAQRQSSDSLTKWEEAWEKEKLSVRKELEERSLRELQRNEEWKEEKEALNRALRSYIENDVAREVAWGEETALARAQANVLENEVKQLRATSHAASEAEYRELAELGALKTQLDGALLAVEQNSTLT